VPLLVIDTATHKYDHACAVCGHTETARPFSTLLTVRTPLGVAVSMYCPACGAVEGFDIRRAAQDATITKPGVSPDRARQARLVRAIVRAAWE
jgi:hypothetical protein